MKGTIAKDTTTPSMQEIAVILSISKDIAREMGANEISTESILYAIVSDGNLSGCKALSSAGISTERLRQILYKRLCAERSSFTDVVTNPVTSNAVNGLFFIARIEMGGPVNSLDLIVTIIKNNNTAAARLLNGLGVAQKLIDKL